MDWLPFFDRVIRAIPLEKVLFPRRNPQKELEKFAKEVNASDSQANIAPRAETAPTPEALPAPPKQGAITLGLPTNQETTDELKRRLAKELYRAQLDLANNLRIAGKPCDCLESKHTLALEATAEELIPMDPGNPVYSEVLTWIKQNRGKVTVEAIRGGLYEGEYPKMAAEFRDFRKKIMGTTSLGAMVQPEVEMTLEQAKKLASDQAAKEVEARWD